MTPRRTAEKRIAEFREGPAKRLWGGRRRDLDRESSYQRVSWTGC